jgi:hypothetical protein
MAWVETIAARPAVARALAAVDDVRTKTTQFDKADAEEMDRVRPRPAYRSGLVVRSRASVSEHGTALQRLSRRSRG